MNCLQTARSFLFVPGDRPDRFDRALASGADVVVIDLEDGVAPERKGRAREAALTWLSSGGRACVRVNPADASEHESDIEAMIAAGAGLLGVMVPKAADDAVVSAVAGTTGVPVIPLIESAVGMTRVHDLASAPGVVRLAFGHLDYAVDLGASTDRTSMLLARSMLVLASRASCLPGPVDGITAAVDDPDLLRDDTRHSYELGMTGKLLVHPRQVDVVHSAFRPSADEIAWAERILTHSAQGGVVRVDGEMIDAPVTARAQAVLRRRER